MDGATPEEESSQSGVNAAMVHAVQQMTGTVKIHNDGKPKMVKPLKKVEIDFPGFGKFKPRIFGHPEAITFPHHFKDIKNSINLAHGSGFGVLKWIMRLVDWRVISIDRAAGIVQNISSDIRNELEEEGIEVAYYSVIYDLIEDTKRLLSGLLEPIYSEKILGLAEVKEVFKSPEFSLVAGCLVTEGLVRREKHVRVLRDNVVIHEGELDSLRRFKDDVKEVQNGTECGIGIKNYLDIKPVSYTHLTLPTKA